VPRLLVPTIGALVLSGHGHFPDGKILAVFDNPVISYKYSIERSLWLNRDLQKQLRSTT